jgi:hypothetical protein
MATFVVTGTGRCGTAHIFKALNQLGVPASHETFFSFERERFSDEDRASYRAASHNDVSLMAAPFLRDVGVPSIHLVREPVACVNSFLHLLLPLSSDHRLCHFINRWVDPQGDTDEERWVDYWEKWNRMCAESATVTLRVEAFSAGDVSEDVLEPIVGRRGLADMWRQLGATPNRLHAVKGSLVPEALVPRLKRAGAEYGYAI